MNTRSSTARAAGPCPGTRSYQVSVAGHLDDHWSGWLGARRMVRHEDSTTELTLESVDQAQLHGVLVGIRDLGATLLSLQPVEGGSSKSHPEAPVLGRTLHTDRLTLRPATADDADATWAYRRLDGVNEWLTGVPESVAAYRTLFTARDRLSTTVIVELVRPDHDAECAPVVIGDFMLSPEDAWAQAEVAGQATGAQAELGWVLDPRYTGAGFATEAVHELLRYCFVELGLHRVVANCFLANETSWRLMERVGMRREAHAINESLHRSGRWLDTLGYALLGDEWHRSHA